VPDGKPNIVVIWGDDIGITNLSCYSDGLMGYRTPNIDRLAEEGMRFTDAYGEQSCTAGRAAFITGQSVYRTGLSKVGLPGAEAGIQAEDPTIAELLKPLGYATGQYGKNHFGDRDEHLPINHGFDEFFGNLYHLNAEEEPEHEDYPDPADYPNFRDNYGPRGVMRCRRDADGSRTIEDTGPLTRKRMETIDDEIIDGAVDFIHRKHAEQTPFFLWVNTTHMHFRTHTKPESRGQVAVGLPRHDGRPRPPRRPGAREARRARHRRGHDRHVLDRQRAAHELLARRRDDAVPQREEHKLGGRLPRARGDPLARAHRGRDGLQRDHQPHGLAADTAVGRRRAGRQAQAARRT
jgi:arylsulfatase A-like enzyme